MEDKVKEFVDDLDKESSKTVTQKGATVYDDAGQKVLNYFFQGGAMRNRPEEDIRQLVREAYSEDAESTILITFYLRDIRGGQGERRMFRIAINEIAQHDERVAHLVEEIPEYGRWDDLFSLQDTQVEEEIWDTIRYQLTKDIESDEGVSLLAKWMPSENASSDETQDLAYDCMDALDLSPRTYRKMLSRLREEIDVVERKMSANEWDNINYEEVPSQALLKYREAFEEHNPEGFAEFMEDVESGEADMNTSTLLPHQIANKVLIQSERDDYLKNAWEELPHRENIDENVLVIADTSGSMNNANIGNVQPIAVSVGLAMFFGECLTGPFANRFMSFSDNPRLQSITGKNIFQKMEGLRTTEWSGTTDFEAALQLILNTAVKNGVNPDGMIDKVLVISDMQFDAARASKNPTGIYSSTRQQRTKPDDKTFMEKMQAKYDRQGFDLPDLVFWNVDAKNDGVPVNQADDVDALLVSGFSPAIINPILESNEIDAKAFMDYVISRDRYTRLKEKL